MHLEYYVQADAFGDQTLTFNSMLKKLSDNFESGWEVTQWYQIEVDQTSDDESEDHTHEDEETGDGEDEKAPWYETVQATLEIDADNENNVGDSSLKQSCGYKQQEEFAPDGVESNDDSAKCSPWALNKEYESASD